jgi:pimeloyl-ACP methyl ester carboxylesterase
MARSQLPTLVLVHGAWHRKEMWRLLINELPGIDIRIVQLPSSAPVPPEQLGDLYDDAAAIRAAVDNVGGPCVVVTHSYGGAPSTQGLAGADTVQRLVYLSGWQLDVGDSIMSQIGRPLDWMRENEALGYYDMMSPREIFYSDLEPGAAAAAAADLGPHSVTSFTQTLTQAAWRTLPTTHILGELDPFVDVYRTLAKRADRVRSIATGHSPFLAKPAELADMIREELLDSAQG